jgi:hypothetical protein
MLLEEWTSVFSNGRKARLVAWLLLAMGVAALV